MIYPIDFSLNLTFDSCISLYSPGSPFHSHLNWCCSITQSFWYKKKQQQKIKFNKNKKSFYSTSQKLQKKFNLSDYFIWVLFYFFNLNWYNQKRVWIRTGCHVFISQDKRFCLGSMDPFQREQDKSAGLNNAKNFLSLFFFYYTVFLFFFSRYFCGVIYMALIISHF